jgi:hypothetical protein
MRIRSKNPDGARRVATPEENANRVRHGDRRQTRKRTRGPTSASSTAIPRRCTAVPELRQSGVMRSKKAPALKPTGLTS